MKTLEKEINPHIPKYMSNVPWYFNSEANNLQHQKKWKSDSLTYKSTELNIKSAWYDRGAKFFHAHKYCKGSCLNCGAMTHNAQSCMEGPRKLGAKWTNKDIAADEKIEMLEFDYETKRDRWNGYDRTSDFNYSNFLQKYEAREKARRDYLESKQLERLNEKDEDKVDEEFEQKGFANVAKHVRTSGGGGESTESVRNLHIREDKVKYILKLDMNSVYYNLKTQSMCEDPLSDADPNERFYVGDNQNRNSGQAMEFKQLNYLFSLGADNDHDRIQMQAAPSQAELLYKNCNNIKAELRSFKKEMIKEKYGNTAAYKD